MIYPRVNEIIYTLGFERGNAAHPGEAQPVAVHILLKVLHHNSETYPRICEITDTLGPERGDAAHLSEARRLAVDILLKALHLGL
jgi:hypothetical protein